jgi:hypothetical protein
MYTLLAKELIQRAKKVLRNLNFKTFKKPLFY